MNIDYKDLLEAFRKLLNEMIGNQNKEITDLRHTVYKHMLAIESNSGSKTILSLNEASEIIKKRPDTTRKMAASGKLKGIKSGRTWVFDPKNITDYLNQGKNFTE